MADARHALLLVGSPKPSTSTSEVLGRYLIDRLAEHGWTSESHAARRVYRSPERLVELLAAVDRCQVLVVSFPLYVDSLPAPLIRVLEEIAGHRVGRAHGDGQSMVAIANCGFPEAQHNRVALDICRQFARESGFAWAGGLSLGGGGAINGRPLGEVGWLARHAIAALNLAGNALAAGEPIPDRAVQRMAKPVVWSRLYTWLGSRGWRRQAAEHQVADRLDDRPYE